MLTATSNDGTQIAYEMKGNGPAIVLVGGGLDDGSENEPLMNELVHEFTVINYARRGRAGSGDTHPYAVDREIEDIDALVAVADGTAHAFGASSGGALTLLAAARGSALEGIAVYDVPYATDEHSVRVWDQYVADLHEALSRGARDEALGLFMGRLAGASEEDIEMARRTSPMWPASAALAHTLAYDAACLGDQRPPVEELAKITQATLVLTGGAADPHMPGLHGFFDDAGDAVAAAIPAGSRRIVEAQSHVADPAVLASVLRAFFAG